MARDVLGLGSDVAGTTTDRQIELGRASITSNSAALTATSFTAVTGLSTTVTTGSRPVTPKVFAKQVINANATLTVITFAIFRDSTQISEAALTLPPSLQFGGWPLIIDGRDAPASGSHTYQLRYKVETGGQSAFILASAVGPATIAIIEA